MKILSHRKPNNMLSNYLESLRDNLDAGMTPEEAVDEVCDRWHLSKEGSTYEYLLRRAKEES